LACHAETARVLGFYAKSLSHRIVCLPARWDIEQTTCSSRCDLSLVPATICLVPPPSTNLRFATSPSGGRWVGAD